jgi:hypothetical protein
MELYDIAQELAAEFENPILIGGIAAIESGYTAESTKDVDMIVVVHKHRKRHCSFVFPDSIISVPVT